MPQIKYFLILLYFTVSLFATSVFLQDNGIVDIGRTIPNTTEVVGKSVIYTSATAKTVLNNIIYRSRIQSPKYNCGTDVLGHQSCEFQETQCAGTVDYTSATSVKHNVTKYLLKVCPQGTIEINNMCYIGNNGIRKDFKKFSKRYTGSGRVCADQPGWLYSRQNGTHLQVGVYAGTHNCGGSGYWALSNVSIPSNIQVGIVHASYSAGCLGGGSLEVQTGTNARTNASCRARGAQHPYVSMSYYYSYTTCPTGYKSDGMYCYQAPHCPQYTAAQSNGVCKMEYNWYSYVCPSGTNIYNNEWKVINPGHNCGNPSCTNSPTPPVNDCERENHTCPLDPNTVCAQIQVKKTICPTGYIYHDNVCERKASYCGSSYYNSQLDVCQNITEYTKLCTDSKDVYDATTNTCVSSKQACPNGIYNRSLQLCTSNYQVMCATPGYVYDAASGYCINPSLKPCANSNYHFDAAKHECVGPMECPNGMTYNPSINKCQQTICGAYGTVDKNGNCELPATDCPGTIISGNRCIPTRIQP